MLLIPPTWLENSSQHNAQDYRVMLASVVQEAGVAGPGAFRVSERAGTASMSVDVAPGGAFIASTRSPQQGMYHAYNTATLEVPLAASDGSNPRIDRILIQVRDEAQDAGLSANDVRIYVEQGTPAAVPEPPEITIDDYLELAQVTVAAGATAVTDSDIVDMRVASTVWSADRGLIGQAVLTGNSGALGGAVTVDEQPGRIYQVHAQIGIYSATTASTYNLYIDRNGSEVARVSDRTAGAQRDRTPLTTSVMLDATEAAQATYSCRLGGAGGTNTPDVQRARLWVIDVGGFLL